MTDREDERKIRKACDEILKYIQPGDVVNQIGEHPPWDIPLVVAKKAIQAHQKKLFGEKSNWQDTHSMFYLDENRTFSVELPRAMYKRLSEYCLTNLSIYRLQLRKLTKEDIRIIELDPIPRMLGQPYDVGQLLDIAFSGDLLGYDHRRPLPIFDFGETKKVCSVGVRIIFEYLYQKIKDTVPPRPEFADRPEEKNRTGKWLFRYLNPGKWPPEKIKKYKGTDIEATSPAHFSNSDFFCDEFALIAHFKDGKRIYPKGS
jgi:hypothetical protein